MLRLWLCVLWLPMYFVLYVSCVCYLKQKMIFHFLVSGVKKNQRVKECNRIEVMVTELGKCGVPMGELEDGFKKKDHALYLFCVLSLLRFINEKYEINNSLFMFDFFVPLMCLPKKRH